MKPLSPPGHYHPEVAIVAPKCRSPKGDYRSFKITNKGGEKPGNNRVERVTATMHAVLDKHARQLYFACSMQPPCMRYWTSMLDCSTSHAPSNHRAWGSGQPCFTAHAPADCTCATSHVKPFNLHLTLGMLGLQL